LILLRPPPGQAPADCPGLMSQDFLGSPHTFESLALAQMDKAPCSVIYQA